MPDSSSYALFVLAALALLAIPGPAVIYVGSLGAATALSGPAARRG